MHNSTSSLIVGNFIGPSTPRFMMIPKSVCTPHMSVNYKSKATFMSIHVIKLNLKILSNKNKSPKIISLEKVLTHVKFFIFFQ